MVGIFHGYVSHNQMVTIEMLPTIEPTKKMVCSKTIEMGCGMQSHGFLLGFHISSHPPGMTLYFHGAIPTVPYCTILYHTVYIPLIYHYRSHLYTIYNSLYHYLVGGDWNMAWTWLSRNTWECHWAPTDELTVRCIFQDGVGRLNHQPVFSFQAEYPPVN